MAQCENNYQISIALRYVLGTVNLVLGLIAVCGNAMVFYVVIGNKKLRTRSNLCLLSLACTDLFVGLIVEPLSLMQFFDDNFRKNCTINLVRRYLSTAFMGASISSIVLISYDRYMHLSKTINYAKHMSKKKLAFLLTVCWLLPFTLPFSRFSSESVYSGVVLVYVIAVFTFMITCYLLIIRIVKRSTISITKSGDGMRQKQTIKGHIKMAKAILTIIVCLLATFAPIAVFHLVNAIDGLTTRKIMVSQPTKEIFYAIIMTIGLANSAINPAIYYLKIPQFKATLQSAARKLLNRFQRSTDGSNVGKKEGINKKISTECKDSSLTV